MSDTSPGPGWWLASDGKWYPPHLHPDVRARADVVVDEPERRDEPEAAAAATTTTTDDGTTVEPDPVAKARPTNGAAAAATDASHGANGHGAIVTPTGPTNVAPTGATTVPPAAAGVTAYVPAREPIDWDQVARERAARRKKEEARRRRNVLLAVGAAVVTLGVLFAVARNVRDDDGAASTEPTASTSARATTDTPSTSDSAAPTTTATPTTTVPGTVSVFALQPGTCVQNPDLITGTVTTVVEVPCDQPHTHEVYHKVTYTPPDNTFDEARISQFASEQCTQSFATYVGVPFDRSKFYYVQFSPTQESWTQKGDREVVCLLFQQGAELTGSARGTAQ